MAWQQFLFVLPNPWTGIDTDGRTYAAPAGHVLHDPGIVPMSERSMVGCSIASIEILQAARLQTVKNVTVRQSPAIQRTRFQYEREPVRVMNTPWYRDEIRKGHLIAANVTTYCAAGGKAEEFVAPTVFLAEARKAATAEMLAANPDMPEPADPLYLGETLPQPDEPTAEASTLADSASATPTDQAEPERSSRRR